ncbi:MAG: hypothetical protein WAM72_24590 [Xanthobacteraceae bacterium]
MGFQPKGARRDSRIDTGLNPPSGFIAAAMHFAVMSPSKRNGKLVADLATERW